MSGGGNGRQKQRRRRSGRVLDLTHRFVVVSTKYRWLRAERSRDNSLSRWADLSSALSSLSATKRRL
jgi:hypothetical protein